MIDGFVFTLLLVCGPATVVDRSAVAEEWRSLDSPFLQARREAELRLRHLPPAEAEEIVTRLIESPRARLRFAAASWYRIASERRSLPISSSKLVAALIRESDRVVATELIHALSHLDQGVDDARREFQAGRLPGVLLDDLVEARVLVLFGEVMHDGGIPGFFDGQFEAIHAIDPTVYGRLIRVSWDPRVHFVIRALSIMALHEPRRENLRDYLEPLLLAPRMEVQVQADFDIKLLNRDVDDSDLRLHLVSRISQYVRFSLAKAGVREPIEEKIEALSSSAEQLLWYAESSGDLTRPDGGAGTLLSLAMESVFEIGYHYQQLDAYDEAEAAYRRILDRPEPIGSKRWAYYNLACIRSLQGRVDEALENLTQAFATGLGNPTWAARDGDLEPLRGDPRFQKLLSDAARGLVPRVEFDRPE